MRRFSNRAVTKKNRSERKGPRSRDRALEYRPDKPRTSKTEVRATYLLPAGGCRFDLGEWTIIGTLASVMGVAISVLTLRAATGAREAARKANESARGRNLVEELEMAERRIHEIGTFLDLDQWPLVRLRAMELVSSCGIVAARWPDKLSEDSRNSILKSQQLAISIGYTAAMARVKAPALDKVKNMTVTQLRASQLISGALAEARSRQERSGA